MTKIVFIINSPLYVRNYVDTGVVAFLAERYEVTVLVSNVENLSLPANARTIAYSISRKLTALSQFLFNVCMYKYKNRSSSFVLRIDRIRCVNIPQQFSDASSIKHKVGRTIKTYKVSLRHYLFKILAFFFPEKILSGIPNVFPLSRGLYEALRTAKPDLILYPSSAYSTEDIMLPKIARLIGAKTFFLIDNWDNLSSKSIILNFPDHIGVWGIQSKEHAIDIQKISPSRVSVLGTPRFDAYFKLRNDSIRSFFSFPYVLFVGTAISFNEANVVSVLNKEIESNPELYGGLKIVYRPHPWRQGTDTIEGLDLKHVVLDPQIAASYLSQKYSVNFQPNLDYYPSLISNARFVVGGFTSMVIEALVFYKSFIGLAHCEENNIASPRRVLAEYRHFRGIESLEPVLVCRDLDDLPALFRRTFTENLTFDRRKVDMQRSYFLYNDNRFYAERLLDGINCIIGSSRTIS